MLLYRETLFLFKKQCFQLLISKNSWQDLDQIKKNKTNRTFGNDFTIIKFWEFLFCCCLNKFTTKASQITDICTLPTVSGKFSLALFINCYVHISFGLGSYFYGPCLEHRGPHLSTALANSFIYIKCKRSFRALSKKTLVSRRHLYHHHHRNLSFLQTLLFRVCQLSSSCQQANVFFYFILFGLLKTLLCNLICS